MSEGKPRMAWKGLRGIALFRLHSQEAEKVAFRSETDDLCTRVASFESRLAKICAEKKKYKLKN